MIKRPLAILVALLIAVCAWIPAIQEMADSQVDAGLKRSLITFASARALNAVISVVQGTELSVQPLGVGVTLTLGQILDPINDLVEQFSSLMLVVSVAFGIQKMLLIIGAHWIISTLVTGFAVVWAALTWWERSPPWMSRVMLVLVMIRFAIPVITIGSDLAFQQVMARDYAESQRLLDISAQEVKDMTPQAPNVSDKTAESQSPNPSASDAETPGTPKKSWLQKLKDWFRSDDSSDANDVNHPSLWDRLKSFNVNYAGVINSLENVPERVVKLIVIFLAQTIIIPLILTWALYVVVLGVIRPSKSRAITG